MFFWNEGRTRSNDGRKGEESGLLSPSRVFLACSEKTDQKNYLAPATQAIEGATKIFILNTYMTIALSISGPMYGGTPPSATSIIDR